MMTDSETQRISKLLSLVLRHKPEKIGVTLDKNGWTDVDTLLIKLAGNGFRVDRDQLRYIVETNNKKRFAFSPDEKRIRANQGHSIQVDLGYTEKQPPQHLYHGTATRFLDIILTEGLKKMNRHHVHLSSEEQTAHTVGSRHGKPIVLTIKAGEMKANGHVFYQSENGVWLTDSVPASYIIHE
ncbi:RNA 2'-phosphotransferase [Spirosoma sp. BT702]|uniref:Probable RNA 2'-phosphotransferase n=1 Tax=Spirosoma profusum TaxID=2771354 RepID=A0A926XYL3_9BACT|nr:RNA 2'-phosphotransferase [Spirosoma profusum]MBD2700218.1 RNA 2'-phosphotransferase [Spirosoma profusum]